jgi:hypothetical protein
MLVFISTVVYLLVSAVVVGNMLADRIQKRADRRPPRRPAAGAGSQ